MKTQGQGTLHNFENGPPQHSSAWITTPLACGLDLVTSNEKHTAKVSEWLFQDEIIEDCDFCPAHLLSGSYFFVLMKPISMGRAALWRDPSEKELR